MAVFMTCYCHHDKSIFDYARLERKVFERKSCHTCMLHAHTHATLYRVQHAVMHACRPSVRLCACGRESGCVCDCVCTCLQVDT